jgi:hypothetical protein
MPRLDERVADAVTSATPPARSIVSGTAQAGAHVVDDLRAGLLREHDLAKSA